MSYKNAGTKVKSRPVTEIIERMNNNQSVYIEVFDLVNGRYVYRWVKVMRIEQNNKQVVMFYTGGKSAKTTTDSMYRYLPVPPVR